MQGTPEGKGRIRGRQKKKQWVDNGKQWTGLSLPVLLDTAQDRNIEGERRRGRQKKKQWVDNGKQWTGLSLPVLLDTAQDTNKWRKS